MDEKDIELIVMEIEPMAESINSLIEFIKIYSIYLKACCIYLIDNLISLGVSKSEILLLLRNPDVY